MNLYLPRTVYTPTSTIGDLLINHNIFCHTLEDVVRSQGAPKVPGRTAIPEGRYQVIVTLSPKFKRMMPILVGVPGFTGIRMHDGLHADHTDGCILLGRAISSNTSIMGKIERELTAMLLAAPETHYIEIIDTFPYVGINE